MDCKKIGPIFILLLILIAISPLSSAQKPDTQSTLVAIYMVGSDLESEYSLATGEVKEILSGLSDNQGSVDLEIAFGGSRAVGWSGMTIADLNTIREDISDENLGNLESYPFRDRTINMGDSSGLAKFLTYLKKLPPHDRTILLFWDHGASSGGLCFDENYDWDSLSLQEIEQTLKESGMVWDLIGMDACLMGSLEVIRAVENYADLLLVSEEVVPGHGWDYKVPLKYLTNHPDVSLQEWGKVVIDAYIDNPEHEKMKKTLSLIDLKKAVQVDEKLSILGDYLDNKLGDVQTYKGIGNSFYNAQRFGYDPKKDEEVSVDLSDFSHFLGEIIPETTGIVTDLNNTIASSVLYQRNDGSRPKSTGISTISPRNKQLDEVSLQDQEEQGRSKWPAFIESYMAYIATDSSKPVIIPFGNNTFQIQDDQGIQKVFVSTDWFPEVTNFSHSYGLKGDPVYPDTQGLYIPNPDDMSFYLVDKNTGNRSLFFHSFMGNDTSQNEMYYGYMNITRNGKTKETAINLIRDKNGNVQYSFFPFETNPDTGEQIFSRVPLTIRAGDIITPIIVERFFDGDARYQFTPLPPLPITGDVEVVRDKLPYGAYFPILWAYDYNMNYEMYLLDNLRFPNNASIAST